MTKYNIAVIEGDGIGRMVVPEGIRVLQAAGRRYDPNFSWTYFDWSCARYCKFGQMMPEDGLQQLQCFDAIYLGAVGYPDTRDRIFSLGFTDTDPAGFSTVCEFAAGTFAGRDRISVETRARGFD